MRSFVLPLLLLVITASSIQAQIFSNRLDTKYSPESAVASLTLFPKQLATEEVTDLFPREILTAWGKKEFGFDPMLMDQITFYAPAPEGPLPPKWAAVLTFSEMQGLSDQLIRRLDKKQLQGHALYSEPRPGLPSFLVVDEATILVGDESMFAAMLTSTGKNRIAQLMKAGPAKGQAVMVVDGIGARPFLNQLAANIPDMLPPALTRVKDLPDLLEGMEVNFVIDKEIRFDLMLTFTDDEASEQAKKILDRGLELGREMGIGVMATQLDQSDPTQAATFDYMQRMAEEYEGKLKPQQNGKQLTLNLKNEVAISPVLVGLLLPAVQATRTAARRTQSMNNMRQMALASHNYESARGKFPAQANYDENGKPLLSWRVHILPYIEQQELYDQFHLDEPWDSPHNRKLISKMPMAYMSPSVGDLGGKTVYLGNGGEQGVFGPKGTTFGMITDGTSNTVMVVEVDPQRAVEWTKPADYELDQNDPMAGLGTVQPGGFLVTLADGSTRFISGSIDPETWKALLTIDGGETANLNDF